MGLAFVRIKRIDGREYYQLVESRRVEGNPARRYSYTWDITRPWTRR